MDAQMRYEKRKINVAGLDLAYVEAGEGDPIVLLHGNPTSSYLWRNVIPELEHSGRVIVPDLIGQGDSAKLPPGDGPLRYRFSVVYDYLDQMLAALGVVDSVTLVIHDWGSALGFHWAKNHPDSMKGIAYMEGIVKPISWDDWPESARGIFQAFRSDAGEELILERNMFVEAVLPSAVLRDLGEEEMDQYRAPFPNPDDRQPLLNWPRQIPIDGDPPEMVALVSSYAEYFAKSDELPKLFINVEPGSILVGEQREFCRSWPNQTEVTVAGAHFVQEDSPREIGQAVVQWLASIP